MTAQGDTYTAVAEFFQYSGGPAVDVTNLTVKVTQVATGTVIVNTTSVGIVHVSTGVYSYPWVISSSATVGDYAIVWVATESQATEVVTVTAAPATGAWCTVADVATITGGLVVTPGDVTCAQNMLEALIHRVWRPTDSARRDYVWLQRGTAWQAAFVSQHPEVKTMMGFQSMSQDGLSLTFPQGWKAYISPQAMRQLDNLFRASNSNIRMNSAFQKNRQSRIGATGGSTPWYPMGGG